MFTYTVHMTMGNDTATTQTIVESETPALAASEAQMKWTGITVKIVNVELMGDCCWDSVDCSMDSHYCSTCETHMESDGTCTNCNY